MPQPTSLRRQQQPFCRRRTFHLMKWERHRRSWILPNNEIRISSRNVPTMCFQHIHCSIVTFLFTPTSRNSYQLSLSPCIWRYETSFSSNNAKLSVPLESMTARMHCFTRTTQSTCITSLLSVSSLHFKSLEISAPPLAFAGSTSSTDTT